MTKLHAELEEAEAAVARLKLAIAQGDCIAAGHDWQHIGGRNAACSDDCGCSVPVYVCAKCGDSDYGDNAEGNETIADCIARSASGERP